MTMHLVRGMTSLNTRKRKAKKKTAGVLEEERKMRELATLRVSGAATSLPKVDPRSASIKIT